MGQVWGESPRFMKIPLVINIINETSCTLPLRQNPLIFNYKIQEKPLVPITAPR